MKTSPYDDDIILLGVSEPGGRSHGHAAAENRYREGGKEEWIELDTVKASDGSYRVEGSGSRSRSSTSSCSQPQQPLEPLGEKIAYFLSLCHNLSLAGRSFAS